MESAMKQPAFVVGACAHSLALVRALARAAIDVHVVEANQSLPGLETRFGTKHIVPDINGPLLIPALLDLRVRHAPTSRPVLFLSNDRMIQSVAANVDQLSQAYAISWGECAQRIAELTCKTAVEARCDTAGLNYPRTEVIQRPSELAFSLGGVSWPCIIKPVRPLSGFKVKYVSSAREAEGFLASHVADFPVLLQQWIPGDDTSIYFTAFYLDHGKPIARFDGRKLRSFPMGHTTVAEPTHNDTAFDCAVRFFEGTGITGPVSLEVKVDPNGQPWVIEPTVGRTDFWVDLCIANGVNLPLIEYEHQTAGRGITPSQLDRTVWINAERDPFALPWYVANVLKTSHLFRTMRFTYLDLKDSLPFFAAVKVFARYVRSALRKRLHSGLARTVQR